MTVKIGELALPLTGSFIPAATFLEMEVGRDNTIGAEPYKRSTTLQKKRDLIKEAPVESVLVSTQKGP